MATRRLIAIGLLAVVAVGFVIYTGAARRRAQSLMCAGRMFPLTFAALQWAQDTGSNHLPASLTYLSNDLPVRLMVCPADDSRRCASGWSSFRPDNSSYEIVAPGTNSVFLRCRFHGHKSYADMTVFDGVRRRRKFE